MLHCAPGILVTGGNNGNNDAGGTAELLHSNGSSWCSLPDLPDMRAHHTQAHLLRVAGILGYRVRRVILSHMKI